MPGTGTSHARFASASYSRCHVSDNVACANITSQGPCHGGSQIHFQNVHRPPSATSSELLLQSLSLILPTRANRHTACNQTPSPTSPDVCNPIEWNWGPTKPSAKVRKVAKRTVRGIQGLAKSHSLARCSLTRECIIFVGSFLVI